MNKAERILGISAAFLFSLGILFKSMHWPGASVEFLLSFLSFNFGYLPLNLIRNYRASKSVHHRIYLIVKFITFFIIVSGFIIKIMHWPGASILVVASSISLPVFLLIYFFVRVKGKGAIPFNLDDLFIAIIAYGIHVFVLRAQISPGVMEGYIIIEEQLTGLNAGIQSSNEIIYSSLDTILIEKKQELYTSILLLRSGSRKVLQINDSLRSEFLNFSIRNRQSRNKNISSFGTRFLANRQKGYQFFIELGYGKNDLESGIDQYMNEINSITRDYNLKSNLIGKGLETEESENRWGYKQTWPEEMFGNIPVAGIFVNLSWLKQMILLTESTVLSGLINQMDLSEETLLLQELASRESDRAINQAENEILKIKQQQELQQLKLDMSQSELREKSTLALLAFIGIAFVLILFIISTRAYMLKQKDNKKLAEQKDILNQQNEEIAAQRDEIEAQRDLVSLQKDQIEKVHNEISASIDYATHLQESILPDPAILKENFSDHFILFRPRDKVSGDFYWWSRIEKHIIIAAADCTGHGVPGAFMSMLGITFLNEVVNKEFISESGSILDQLRMEVIRSLNQTEENEDQKDGLDISLVSINTETWICQFAGANNPMYLIRNNVLKEFKADTMPISIYQRMDKFTTHEFQLERGDQIYLFSDGYADQFGGEDRKKFKYKAFKKLLLDHTNLTMNRQNEVFAETIVKWQGDNEQIDDMVVVGLKV